MDAKYGLIIKRGSEAAKNSFTEWGIACANVPFKAGGKTKELPKRNWYDEQGEDTYLPKKLMFEAYDAEFEVACVVPENAWNLSAGFSRIDTFKKWLSGNDTQNGSGASMQIYSPFSGIGRKDCYLLEISDEEPHLQLKEQAGNVYNENVLTFKIKLRVTDPMTNITLTAGS